MIVQEKRSILIVEDEQIPAMVLKKTLISLGYRVTGIASSGERAIAMADVETPDLILMDIHLAGRLSGIEAAEQVLLRHSVPIIYVTAYADRELVEQAKLTNPYGYIIKPYNEREIQAGIEIALYKSGLDRNLLREYENLEQRVIERTEDLTMMNAALRKSETRYRLLFERSGEGIFIFEAEGEDRGRIIEVNETGAAMHGYLPEELLNLKITDLDVAENLPVAPARFEDILRGEWIGGESNHVRKDGSVFPLDFQAGLLELGGHNYIFYVMRDISERKRVRDALQASETRYRRLFETTQDGILILDAETGQITDVNPFLINLLGFSREQFLGKKIWDIGVFKDIIANIENFGELQWKESIRYEDRPLETADGRNIAVEFVSNVYMVNDKKIIQCNIRDITERKKTEVALNATETRYRRLFETAQDGILILDAGTGQIVEVNPFLIAFLGFSREQFLGKKIWEIGLFKDIVANKDNFEELQRKESIRYENLPLETADGRNIAVEFVSNVYMVNDKKVIQCNIRDITERKLAQEALNQVNRKLTMLNTITRHDILNQLMVLQIFIEFTKEDVTDPVVLGYIQKEEQAAKAIQWQIEFTRNYQDIGTQAPKWQIVSDIITSAIRQLNPPGIQVDVNVGDVELFADPLINKVFYNLMENSLRHGGHVTHMDYSVRETEDGLILVYSDDGVGITPEDKKNLFRKGFGKHTGLGLFLSREILSITGITITETGEPGKGARFEMTVPNGGYRFTGAK